MFEICKISQKTFRIYFLNVEKAFIARMPKLIGHEWDGKLDYRIWRWGDKTKIGGLIEYIRLSLEESQGLYCAYCGMRLGLTSNAQIEHIAPKGIGRYPQFMFHSANLTLACSLCNGFEKKEKKGNFKTIGKLAAKYEDSYFNIVHPYLDDPSLHLTLGRNGQGVTISSISLKGQKSIAVFTLDDEPQTNARGEHLRKYLLDFDPRFDQAYEKACALKGY